MAVLELLTLNLIQMTIESTEHTDSTNPPLLIASVSGCTGHFLTEAVNSLVYKTPRKIIDYVEKHKHDYLIQNPPFDVRQSTK